MSSDTHYKVLGVSRWATVEEIKAAHRKIVLVHHPDKTVLLGPFARAQGEQLTRAANLAWETLSDPQARRKYDKTLPRERRPAPTPDLPQKRPAPTPNTPNTPKRPAPTPNMPKQRPAPTPESSADHKELCDEAEYRYRITENGTEVEIVICDWEIALHISPKFRFTNDMADLSKRIKGAQTIRFEMGLERNTASGDQPMPSANEVTVKVASIPNYQDVVSLQSLFKEVASSPSTLTLTITAAPGASGRGAMPWSFAFDFDKNGLALARNRGTHIIFTREEPSQRIKGTHVHRRPKFALKNDKLLRADEFVNIMGEGWYKVRHGDVEMWRHAAVGYRKGV